MSVKYDLNITYPHVLQALITATVRGVKDDRARNYTLVIENFRTLISHKSTAPSGTFRQCE